MVDIVLGVKVGGLTEQLVEYRVHGGYSTRSEGGRFGRVMTGGVQSTWWRWYSE